MRRLGLCALLLAACGATAAAPSTTEVAHNEGPSVLGPRLTRAELDAHLADGTLTTLTLAHLDSAALPVGWLEGDPPRALSGADNVLEITECRPDGPLATLFVDGVGQVYVVFGDDGVVSSRGAAGPLLGLRIAMPESYCSLARYQLEPGQGFAGQLTIDG
mgnify:CR=1 FL=1